MSGSTVGRGPWRRALGVLLALGLGAVAGARGAAAQVTGCDVARAGTVWYFGVEGARVAHASGPLALRCDGGVSVSSDSAVYSVDAQELVLVGRAAYGDPATRISADRIEYRPAQVVARGRASFTDRRSGDVLRGPLLVLDRRTGAVSAPARSSAVMPSRDGDVRIDADALTVSDGRLRAAGRVRLRRGDQTGTADSVASDPVTRALELRGGARLDSRGSTLRARAIRLEPTDGGGLALLARADATLDGAGYHAAALEIELRLDADSLWASGRGGAAPGSPAARARVVAGPNRLLADSVRVRARGGKLREVVGVGGAEGEAGRDASGVHVEAERVRLLFDDGAFRRLAAGGAPGPDGGARARATSRDFRLAADSLDATGTGGALKEVRGIGGARLEQLPDSLAAGVPEALALNWLRGDTIVGTAATDSTAGRAGLERLSAIGGAGPAQALYRWSAEARRDEVIYVSASRINLRLRDGRPLRLEAEGGVRGTVLQPRLAHPPGRPR